MGVPNGNGNAPIDAWLSRWAETKAGHAAAGWGAAPRGVALRGPGGGGGCAALPRARHRVLGKAGEEEDPITTAGFPADQLLLAGHAEAAGTLRGGTRLLPPGPLGQTGGADPVASRVRGRADHERRTPSPIRSPRSSPGGSGWGPSTSLPCSPARFSGCAAWSVGIDPGRRLRPLHLLRRRPLGVRRALDASAVPLRPARHGCRASRSLLLMRPVRPSSAHRSRAASTSRCSGRPIR